MGPWRLSHSQGPLLSEDQSHRPLLLPHFIVWFLPCTLRVVLSCDHPGQFSSLGLARPRRKGGKKGGAAEGPRRSPVGRSWVRGPAAGSPQPLQGSPTPHHSPLPNSPLHLGGSPTSSDHVAKPGKHMSVSVSKGVSVCGERSGGPYGGRVCVCVSVSLHG